MDSPTSGKGLWHHQQSRACRGAFTVLELLVSIATIGVLISLLLPAVMYARESARRLSCTSHLREIGIAIHSYHDSRKRLPSGWQIAERDLNFVYGWAAQLLPELEQQGLRQKFDLKHRPPSLSDGSSAPSLPILLCPSDLLEKSFDLLEEEEEEQDEISPSSAEGRRLMELPTASYVGVYGTVEADDTQELSEDELPVIGDGAIIFEHRVRFVDLRRGLNNTLLTGERMMATLPSTWLGIDLRGDDAPCRLMGSAMTKPNCSDCDECEFTSRHVGGSNFLWADGHVARVDDTIDSVIYSQLARREVE